MWSAPSSCKLRGQWSGRARGGHVVILCNSENDADRETELLHILTAQPVYRGLNRAGVKVSLTQLAALAAQ